MRKYAIFTALACVAAYGCGNSSSSPTNSPQKAPAKAEKTTPAASPVQAPSAEKTPSPGVISTLKNASGKYPQKLKLLDDPELKSRLEKILGPEYAAFKANWNVETPIEIENGILMTSGCEQHNCGANAYYLFADLEHDNINVYHVEKGTQFYGEKGRIDLPKKFADSIVPAN